MGRDGSNGNSTSLRCAIYTRKSTAEGLEKDFNSLDAQREAAEAYIESQKHQGWICLDERYDDGGFSGATLERPALARLIADIEAKRLDCVMVYKVDRLSRSLLDFTRLLDRFDRNGVTFVSITQQFQTTTSMGRLTLNVLLSFAQFEREMIAERTRDKMAAARRKGKWVGGFPILGYDIDPEGGRLVVNSQEARQVNEIFRLYVELESLDKVLRELDRRGSTTKSWTTRKGRTRGGSRFSKSTLSHLLRHRYYVGKVRYRNKTYAGEHEAIVERGLFAQAQRVLRRAFPQRRPRVRSGALLSGRLYCAACDVSMAPTYTSKGSRRYRYYQCTGAQREGYKTCPQASVPAPRIERVVVGGLRAFGRGDDESETRAACRMLDETWDVLSTEQRQGAVEEVLSRADYDARKETVTMRLLDGLELVCPLRLPRGRDKQPPRGAIPKISRLMARVIHFDRLLSEGLVKDYAELARRENVTRARITQIMNLLHLAPDIQERLLFLKPVTGGRAPVTEHGLREVMAQSRWAEQRRILSRLLPT